MKRLYAPGTLLVLLTSCLGFKELPVEYDYSYKGNFKNYRTYNLLQASRAADKSQTDKVIEQYILARMKFLGYRQVDSKPHLLITYKMFPDSLTFNGYNQPDIEDWIETNDENLNYDKKKLNLSTGTLLIQLFDRRQNRAIWQGYATTLYGSIDFNDNRHLRNAVISILDKYRFWAEGFMEGQASPDEATEERF
jgi:hypothetical protein